MNTYIFVEKNGCGTLTISAQDNDEAIKYLEGIVSQPMGWRLDSEEE